MLGCVLISRFVLQFAEDASDARGAIGRDLLSYGQMQTHVKERVCLAAVGCEIAIQVVAAYRTVVFRMHLDDISNLGFEW